jgi:hypothetical protein
LLWPFAFLCSQCIGLDIINIFHMVVSKQLSIRYGNHFFDYSYENYYNLPKMDTCMSTRTFIWCLEYKQLTFVWLDFTNHAQIRLKCVLNTKHWTRVLNMWFLRSLHITTRKPAQCDRMWLSAYDYVVTLVIGLV